MVVVVAWGHRLFGGKNSLFDVQRGRHLLVVVWGHRFTGTSKCVGARILLK